MKASTRHSTKWLEQFQSWWFRLPEPIRFFVSGNLGNACLFLCDRGVSSLLLQLFVDRSTTIPLSSAAASLVDTNNMSARSIHPTICFFLAYLLHIPAQHILHATLVYGLSSINTRLKYVTTLLETYSALGTSAVGSSLLNGYLRQTVFFRTQRGLAFCLTMALFAVVNYTLMQWIMVGRRTLTSPTMVNDIDSSMTTKSK